MKSGAIDGGHDGEHIGVGVGVIFRIVATEDDCSTGLIGRV